MRNPEVGGAGHGVHRPNAGQQGFGKAMTAQDDTIVLPYHRQSQARVLTTQTYRYFC